MIQPQYERENVTMVDMVPKTWFSAMEGSSVLVAGYKVLRVGTDNRPSGTRIFGLELLGGVILHGQFRYPRPIELAFTDDEQIPFRVPDPLFAETEEGVYLLLFT